MKRSIALLGTIAALALAGSAANATTVPIGTFPPANPFFIPTSETPGDSSVTAIFGDTIMGASTAFDDIFTFTLPLSGVGSGSASTSFSSEANFLGISSVTINGKTFTAPEAALGVSGIPIMAGALNTIEVIGSTGPTATSGTYDGTATFSTGAVPEPATWGMMLVGLGMIGFAARHNKNVSVSYA